MSFSLILLHSNGIHYSLLRAHWESSNSFALSFVVVSFFLIFRWFACIQTLKHTNKVKRRNDVVLKLKCSLLNPVKNKTERIAIIIQYVITAYRAFRKATPQHWWNPELFSWRFLFFFYHTESVYIFESVYWWDGFHWKISLDANPMNSRRQFIKARRLLFAMSVWNLDSSETTKKNKARKIDTLPYCTLYIQHSTFSLWMSADTRMLNILSVCNDLFYCIFLSYTPYSLSSIFTIFHSWRKKSWLAAEVI